MKQIFIIALCALFQFNALSQSITNFPNEYYFGNEKIQLDFEYERLLVKFASNVSENQQEAILEDLGLEVDFIDYLSGPGLTLVYLNQAVKKDYLSATLTKLDNHAQIQYASPFFIYDETHQTVTKAFLVKLNSISDFSLLQQMADAKGATILNQVPNIADLYLLEANGTNNAIQLANEFHESQLFEYAEPNFIRILKPFTNDPLFGNQWSIENLGTSTYPGATPDADMDVNDAWAITTGSSSIKIAVLDEGVDLNHPDLVNNMLTGYDATFFDPTVTSGTNSNGGPTGDDAHGTACAGIIASEANNNIGTAGVAYDCKIIPVRIAYSNSSGSWVTSNAAIGDAINWAWQTANADILSNSWGGGSSSTVINNAFSGAVTQGRGGLGAPVLIAAGNGDGNVSYPATLSYVIAVGAMSMCNERKSPSSCDGESWWGSDYGTDLDIMAPGVKIHCTDISGSAGYSSGDYTATFNGTSSATPNAAGVMALILSANATLQEAQARVIIESTCDKVGGYSYATNGNNPNGTWHNEMGYGRVNAYSAVNIAVTGCLNPILSVSGVTSSTLNLTINSSSGLYNIEYGVSGFAQGTGTMLTGYSSNTLSVSNLSSNTAYDFYIQADCGSGTVSNWSISTFSTACGSFTAPFTEDWENTPVTCWTQDAGDVFDWTQLSGATGSSSTGPSSDHSGTYYMYIETSSPRVDGDIANMSTNVDLSALTNPSLTFWYHMYGATIGTLNIDVEYPVGTGTFTNVWTLSGNQGDNWNEAIVSLAAYTGQTVGIRIQGICSTSYTGDIAVGNFVFDEGPACFDVSDVSTALSGSDLTLSWNAGGTETNWQIEYGLTGFTQGSGTIINHNATSYTFTGLTMGTYDFYVRSDCGNGDYGAWNQITSFVPAPGSVALGVSGGTAVNSTTTVGPINIYYRSLRYQTVYTAAEIIAAGGVAGDINGLAWYVESVPINDMPNYTIRIKHTTATDASSSDTTGLTQVYMNSLYSPTAGGFDQLAFQTPFAWNGTDNILVDICFDRVSAWNSSGQTRMYSATNGARYIRSDNADLCGYATSSTLSEKPQVLLSMTPQPTGPTPPTGPTCLVNWTNLQSAVVLQGGRRLRKNVQQPIGWTGAALSQNSLHRLDDGWVEMEALRTDKAFVYGLGWNNNSADIDSIRFGIELFTNGTAYVRENGFRQHTIGSYSAGDKFIIAKMSGQVHYFHNGTWVYTSVKNPWGFYHVDASIRSMNGTVYEAYSSFSCISPEMASQGQMNTSLGTNQAVNNFNDVVAYPNPFENNITVDYAAYTDKVESIELYNSNGQHIRSVEISENGQSTIDTNDITSGLYILTINGVKHLKVVKM